MKTKHQNEIELAVSHYCQRLEIPHNFEWRFGVIGIDLITHPKYGDCTVLYKDGILALVDRYNFDDERDIALAVQGKKNKRARIPSKTLEVLNIAALQEPPMYQFDLYKDGNVYATVEALDACDAFRVAEEKKLPVPDWAQKGIAVDKGEMREKTINQTGGREMIYKIESPQIDGWGEYKTEEAAISGAKRLSHKGYDVQVVAIEQSGGYRSRTVVWPTRGETRTA